MDRARIDPTAWEWESLWVAGHEFFVLSEPTDPSLWKHVGLDEHAVASLTEPRRQALQEALDLIATRPNALALLYQFVTTFVWVEHNGTSEHEPPLTSCSLPDFPFMVFFSDTAMRHIPPVSIADQGSTRLLAENIYHEAVHQLVNYRILVEDVFVPSYDSRTSPRVPIAWRNTSVERNQAWEIDRVFHAATVYSQLLDWRLHELQSGSLTSEERSTIGNAARDALESSKFLTDALTEHLDVFTTRGALYVGQLTQAVASRSRLVEAVMRRRG